MPLGFYFIMAAQFCSALADNILLIGAMSALREIMAPESHEPLLKSTFVLSYVLLAPFVGAFADSMPKGKVMYISNLIKIIGCLIMAFNVHPLFAYAIVGLGAAAYSPAKYGIVTEYLPHRLLVVANSWIEGLTIGAIISGVVLGGILIDRNLVIGLNNLGFTIVKVGSESHLAMIVSGAFYLLAAILNHWVPITSVTYKPINKNPWALTQEFSRCVKALWKDHLGQISLAVTTLFWGAGATLQFIIINWAESALFYDLSKASKLQGIVALGVGIGAVIVAKFIPLKKAPKVAPLCILMGLLVISLNLFSTITPAVVLLFIVGVVSGFIVVPMNALLQHRGHILIGAGHSIAVQNFNENLSILIMTMFYYYLISYEIAISTAIYIFGIFLTCSMLLVYIRNQYLLKKYSHYDSLSEIDDINSKH